MEPLAESAQYADILRDVLKYRRQKALQLELTRETLASKSAQLTTLEKSEQEARRIEASISRIEGSQIFTPPVPRTAPSPSASQSPPMSPADPPSSPEQERDEDDISPSKTKPKKRLSGVGKVFGLGKLNYAMRGIVDVDPETTRRNNIGKTRESIAQVIF